eukprot:GHVL01039767.1.p1 GENE.GHVL01039767.1~~GHVL01039767.1.p1  ORF type:complete len:357 (+),score=75.64 GHVL01039767.1:44-1072(+)
MTEDFSDISYNVEDAELFLQNIPLSLDNDEPSDIIILPKIFTKNIYLNNLSISRDKSDIIEKNLINNGILGSRIEIREKIPIYIYSILKCDFMNNYENIIKKDIKNREPMIRLRFLKSVSPVIRGAHTKGKRNRQPGISYSQLLSPGHPYHDAYYIDTQALQRGGHQTSLAVGGYQMTTIPYVKELRLRQDLNDEFRKLNPWLHKTMSLSKLRNLKADLFNFQENMSVEIEISTVAMAWMYFEKLVMNNYVAKANRKLFAGVCLVLAYKFNQAFRKDHFSRLVNSIKTLDHKDRLDEQQILEKEFQVYAYLEFSLMISGECVCPLIEPICAQRNIGIDFDGT